MSQTGNTAYGLDALASTNHDTFRNSAFGESALKTTTNGSENVAIGFQSLLSNTSGDRNTAIGYNSLGANTNGIDNTAIGSGALFRNFASNNTAVGADALNNNEGGYKNTAIGQDALSNNKSGFENTALGVVTLWYNDHGDKNTAIGFNALHENKGDNNTAIGHNAGSVLNRLGNENGNNNTFLGYNSQASIVNAINQTVLGYEATGQENNSVVLGNDAVTSVYMAEDSGAIVYAAGMGTATDNDLIQLADGTVTVNGNITVSSDARLKSNINSLAGSLRKILKLDGKSYITNHNGLQSIGVLAQDVKEVFPELVSEDEEGMLSVNYQGLIPIVINALKEQEIEINHSITLTTMKKKE